MRNNKSNKTSSLGLPKTLSLTLSVGLCMGLAPNLQAQSDSAGLLEEIIVTARKREERLQDTPISVTALTAEGLSARGVESTTDIGNFTPNLVSNTGNSVSGNSSAASFFIRGIGQIDFTLNTDPGVGLYVDDVYIARSLGSGMDLLDLQSVEVLRGPQGTLFGRNTIGGAISLRSQPPSEEQGLKASIAVGSDNLQRAKFAADLPVSEDFLTRFSLGFTKQDGYVKRVVDGVELGDTDGVAARLATRWYADEALTVDLAVDAAKHREESPATVAAGLNGLSDFGIFHNLFSSDGVLGPPVPPMVMPSGNPECFPDFSMGPPTLPASALTNPNCFTNAFVTNANTTFSTGPSGSELDVFGAALTLTADPTDALTIKSITSFRDTEAMGFRDGDNTPFIIAQTQDIYDHQQFSEELQLSGNGLQGDLNWIVGLYYFQEEGTNINLVNFAPVYIQSGGDVDNDSVAVFGQATWDFADIWSLTLGLRYTDETKRFNPDQFVIDSRGNPMLPPGVPLVPPVEVESSVDDTSPLVNLSVKPSDNTLLYASYSEGFKGGGFTQRVFPPLPATPSFRPEFAKSYEVGYKVDAFDQRLRLNTSVFFTDYTDLQVLVLVGVAPTTQNAAEAEIKGLEVEMSLRPTDALSIEAGVGYTDAEYTRIDASVIGISLQSEFAQIPELTGNTSLSYDLRLGESGTLIPRLDYVYHSDVFLDATNTPEIHQDSYGLINASLTWLSDSEEWQVRLQGTNLSDERYFTAGFADLPVSGIAEAVVARGKEWSLQAEYSF